MPELSDKQIGQIDIVNNAAYNAMVEALGFSPPWDMEWIGELSDKMAEIAEDYFDMDEIDFYPYVDEI